MSLKKLSDEALLTNTKNLVARERELLIDILNHLKEIDSRKLYLEIGFPSLWAYCTKELGYTEAAAQRRIEAMRALREMPVLAEKIESGSLPLSSIAKVQSLVRKVNQTAASAGAAIAAHNGDVIDGHNGDVIAGHNAGGVKDASCGQIHISSDQKLDLLLALEYKSQREADRILANCFPQKIGEAEKVRPVGHGLSEIKFMADGKLMEKLEKVRSLLSHKDPNPSFAELLSLMADFVIAKKYPLAKKVAHMENFDAPPPPPSEVVPENSRKPFRPHTKLARPMRPGRYIPAAIKRDVWRAAGGCCEYKDPRTNRRCGSRHQLEVEHITPKAFGGSNDRENLRLYCRAHNQFAAHEAMLM